MLAKVRALWWLDLGHGADFKYDSDLALSSGEADFHGMVHGARGLFGLGALARDMCHQLDLRLWIDNSADIWQHRGCGTRNEMETSGDVEVVLVTQVLGVFQGKWCKALWWPSSMVWNTQSFKNLSPTKRVKFCAIIAKSGAAEGSWYHCKIMESEAEQWGIRSPTVKKNEE